MTILLPPWHASSALLLLSLAGLEGAAGACAVAAALQSVALEVLADPLGTCLHLASENICRLRQRPELLLYEILGRFTELKLQQQAGRE